jgi:hypothetical protein
VLCFNIIVEDWGNQALSVKPSFPFHLCFVGKFLTLNIRCAFHPDLAACTFASILKMEAAASSEQLLSFHQATWRHIQDYGPLQ